MLLERFQAKCVPLWSPKARQAKDSGAFFDRSESQKTLGLLVFLLLFSSSPLLASPPLEGTWSGIAICSSMPWRSTPEVREANLEIKPDGGNYHGILTIEGFTSEESFTISRYGEDKYFFDIKDKYRWLKYAESGPVIYDSHPHLSYLAIGMRKPCSDLFLVRGHEQARLSQEFHAACAKFNDLLIHSSNADALVKNLKRKHEDTLSDYDADEAKISTLISDEVFEKSFGIKFSSLTTDQISRIALHIADCGRYSSSASSIEKSGAFLLKRNPQLMSRWRFWRSGAPFDSVVSAADLQQRAEMQAKTQQALREDLLALQALPEKEAGVPEFEAIVTPRAKDLSWLSPYTVEAYLTGVESLLAMLKAARHLAQQFDLQELPKLPSPDPATMPDDETLKPLTEEQMDELSGVKVRKF